MPNSSVYSFCRDNSLPETSVRRFLKSEGLDAQASGGVTPEIEAAIRAYFDMAADATAQPIELLEAELVPVGDCTAGELAPLPSMGLAEYNPRPVDQSLAVSASRVTQLEQMVSGYLEADAAATLLQARDRNRAAIERAAANGLTGGVATLGKSA